MTVDELVEELTLLGDQQAYLSQLPPEHPKRFEMPDEKDIHEMADSLLLTFINDGRVMAAFQRVSKD